MGGAGYDNFVGHNMTTVNISPRPSLYQGPCTNVILVFDTKLERWSYTNSLPLDLAIPFTVVKDGYLYVLGGEQCVPSCVGSQKYGVHSDLVLRARIFRSTHDFDFPGSLSSLFWIQIACITAFCLAAIYKVITRRTFNCYGIQIWINGIDIKELYTKTLIVFEH